MFEADPKPIHPLLMEALETNPLLKIEKVKSGKLVITIIEGTHNIDCGYDNCYDFADYLVLYVDNGVAEDDMHVCLCKRHLTKHVEYAKAHGLVDLQ